MITRPTYTIEPHICTDANTGRPVFALTCNNYSIADPFRSECGRFGVDPVSTYGLSLGDAKQLEDLNERLGLALDEVTHAVSRAYQEPFGVPAGDSAGIFFSNEDAAKPLYDVVVKLVCQEFGFRDVVQTQYPHNIEKQRA